MRIPDALAHFPEHLIRYSLETLLSTLPFPVPDTQEARRSRDEIAIAAVAELRPGDAFELSLVTEIVATSAHVSECFRLSGLPGLSPREILRYRAQAKSFMRLTKSGLDLLRQGQAARQRQPTAAKRPAPNPGVDPATIRRARPRLQIVSFQPEVNQPEAKPRILH